MRPIARYVSAANALILFIMTASLLVGCSTPYRTWMGTYRGRRILKNRAEMPEPIRDTLEAVKLTILDGGRFELIDAGMPASGSWSYEDGIGKFHIETQMGKAISDLGIGAEQRNITIEVRQLSDDVMEWYDAGSFDKSRIRLERVLPSER